jgi:hypothetical protein
MGRYGEVGDPVLFPVLMMWVYGNIFVWGGRFFKSHIRFDPREGSKICFWDDVWCGDRPLKVAFHGLFNIASFKEESIADNLERANGAIQ